MIPQISKDTTRQRVHSRIRKKLQGSEERPRLNVYRSLNHIYAQVIDDEKGVTIAAASTTMASATSCGATPATATSTTGCWRSANPGKLKALEAMQRLFYLAAQ